MAKMTDTAAQAAIGAATRELHLPTVRTESLRLAEVAERGQATYLGYLAEVLAPKSTSVANGGGCAGCTRPGSRGSSASATSTCRRLRT